MHKREVQLPFYTVGHSTRTIEEFVELLQTAEVTLVIDIRTIPKSRTNPQYNKDTLPERLAAFNIGYEYIDELGGLRSKSKDVQASVNSFWQNQSFHNYADYTLTKSFCNGLAHMIRLGRQQRCVMMCSEAVWWRCHRRIVADYLIARGESVFHLMVKNKVDPAKLTEGALIQEDGTVIYPAEKIRK